MSRRHAARPRQTWYALFKPVPDMSDASLPPTSARLINLAGHELRTPASVVIGYLRMLLAEHPGPLTDRQRMMLSEAQHSSQRMNAIIAEMSELSNLEAGTLALARQRIVVAPLLRQAIGAVGPLESPIGDGQPAGPVEAHMADEGAAITGDPARLCTAIASIVRAMARERRDATPLIVDGGLQTNQAQRMVLIRIGAEASVPLLGGPRGEFDRWRGGLGLSLPIAQLVIEAAGGQIWSPPGDGNHAATGMAFPVTE